MCNLDSKSQCKEPLKPHEVPEGPWKKVGADLFSFGGQEYLIMVDYYSFCARYGVPEEVITDNDPQFCSCICEVLKFHIS